ncbi:hypothetical protein F5050DRAFT_1531334, partial [Lentinula boryana]
CEVKHGAQPMKTDHFPIETIFDLQTDVVDPRQRRNWKAADWDEIRKDLEERLELLGEPNEITTEDDFWRILKTLDSTVEEVIDEHIPYNKPSPHQRRWWNKDLTQMRKTRNNLG